MENQIMMLHLPEVLTPAQVGDIRARLDAADWTDGRATVGPQGARSSATGNCRNFPGSGWNSDRSC